MNKLGQLCLMALTAFVLAAPIRSQIPAPNKKQSAKPARVDVPYVPTPMEVVNRMLKIANVGKDDVVYDLGCGDGRIVVAAVKDFGAKSGFGVDLDPELIQRAKHKARRENIAHKAVFYEGDLFKQDLREATVVTLYLYPSVNLRLLPKLLEELKPGTRIVSHNFDMGAWKPEKTEKVGDSTVYFWTIPTDKKSVPTVQVFRGEPQKQ